MPEANPLTSDFLDPAGLAMLVPRTKGEGIWAWDSVTGHRVHLAAKRMQEFTLGSESGGPQFKHSFLTGRTHVKPGWSRCSLLPVSVSLSAIETVYL